jgi:hypothetical protein
MKRLPKSKVFLLFPYIRFTLTKNILLLPVKYALLVFVFFLSTDCLPQAAALRWYTLESAVSIDEVRAKELTVLMRGLENDSIVRFNPKRQMLVLAVTSELNMPMVMQRLNNFGFYFGDVTENAEHRTGALAVTSLYYQTVLQCTQPISKPERPKYFILNQDEYQALPALNRQKADEMGLEVIP